MELVDRTRMKRRLLGCLGVVVVAALIGGGSLAWGWAKRQLDADYRRFQPLVEELAGNLRPDTSAWIDAVFVIGEATATAGVLPVEFSNGKPEFAGDVYDALGTSVRAGDPDDVRTVALINIDEQVVGEYVFGSTKKGTAYQGQAEIVLIDADSGEVLRGFIVEGPEPPETSESSEHTKVKTSSIAEAISAAVSTP